MHSFPLRATSFLMADFGLCMSLPNTISDMWLSLDKYFLPLVLWCLLTNTDFYVIFTTVTIVSNQFSSVKLIHSHCCETDLQNFFIIQVEIYILKVNEQIWWRLLILQVNHGTEKDDLLKGLQLAGGRIRPRSHTVCFLSNTPFY